MKIFCTGASGYIGGSVAAKLVAEGHDVSGLARSKIAAKMIEQIGATPIYGSLDDGNVLRSAAEQADMVVNCANADHRGAVETMLEAMRGSGKKFIHTSGSSLVGQRARGIICNDVFDDDTPVVPSPARKARVALNTFILASAKRNIHSIVICPSLIYGLGLGVDPHSMQVPWLIDLARKEGIGKHIGPGTNIWSNVHISDLADLYSLAISKAPAGSFYYAENGENSMLEMTESISYMLGYGRKANSMSMTDAEKEWGEGPANDTMGSNSRVRANRARSELAWSPTAISLIQEIERGCYVGYIK